MSSHFTFYTAEGAVFTAVHSGIIKYQGSGNGVEIGETSTTAHRGDHGTGG